MFFGGDPFDHFQHGHGGRARGRRSSQSVENSKLYEVLEIEKTATETQIKKAYRRLAVRHHPDKGGDESKFKEVSAAYEILSDPEKRAKYDRFGLEGVANDGPGGGGGMAEDIFSMFFQEGRRGRPRTSPDVKHTLKVSLEDLYNGKTVKMAVSRQVLVGEPQICYRCDGEGAVVELRHLALGMVQQIQRTCYECGGQGYRAQVQQERKVLEVHVEKGMKHSQKITFRGLADEKPNLETGDVHFVLHEKQHDVFERKGADLLITKIISLNEALCGFEFELTHLDGRQLIIESKSGEIIPPVAANGKPSVKIVPNEGMPSRGNPFIKGDLYVVFQVTFPQSGDLTPNTIEILKAALPDPCNPVSMKSDEDDEEPEQCHLEIADAKNFGKGGAADSSSRAYESDEDGHQVRCQQS